MNPWVTDRFVFIFQDPPTPGVHLVETYGRYVYACMNYVYIYIGLHVVLKNATLYVHQLIQRIV